MLPAMLWFSGVSNLVVNNEVDRSTDSKVGYISQRKRLGYNTLSKHTQSQDQ